MERGKRYAVCDKTYNLYKKAPYRARFEFVDPLVEVPLDQAKPFDCSRTALRHPKETKGQNYDATTEANNRYCDDGSCGGFRMNRFAHNLSHESLTLRRVRPD